jgi:hypothetical protein
MEKDDAYFAVASERIRGAQAELAVERDLESATARQPSLFLEAAE